MRWISTLHIYLSIVSTISTISTKYLQVCVYTYAPRDIETEAVTVSVEFATPCVTQIVTVCDPGAWQIELQTTDKAPTRAFSVITLRNLREGLFEALLTVRILTLPSGRLRLQRGELQGRGPGDLLQRARAAGGGPARHQHRATAGAGNHYLYHLQYL